MLQNTSLKESEELRTEEIAKTSPDSGPIVMRVKKRNGDLEPVDVNKIINVVVACSSDLKYVDPMKVATKVISGLYDGASTQELDQLCIQTASMLITEDTEYSKLAARLTDRYIEEEVTMQNIHTFYDSIIAGRKQDLISEKTFEFVKKHKEPLNIIAKRTKNYLFDEYFGIKTLYDRYLLKGRRDHHTLETPKYFFLRVACGLSKTFEEAKELYEVLSNLDYVTSSPTLFNSGTSHPQLSSCYLLDSPDDSLVGIYGKYKDIALLSKFAGGIGVSFSRVRSRGSLIGGTNGKSNGLIPFLKTLDSSVAAVNQGGRRKGAACVYLETWHADIEEFLELRNNTGDEAQRTHNLNLANWIPDLFMRRVQNDETWSLFDPKDVPHFVDTFGEEFEKAYAEAEKKGLYRRQVKARDLYSRMMKTLAQTGNGWVTFKDMSNLKCNQTGKAENVVHLSNLCTEILEVTSSKHTAVCNLGSINLSNHFEKGNFNFDKLAKTVKTAVKFLDRVVDINFYPIDTAKSSNNKWRPVGLGLMGLQDVFFKMKVPFDSPEAQKISKKISEEIYYNALKTSCELAKEKGKFEAYDDSRIAKGHLQFDLWGVEPTDKSKWDALREDIKKYGVRNSLLIAIAPTATIASISGVYEAIEPQISNYFKRETLSGEFIQLNKYLVQTLKEMNLWNDTVRDKIKAGDGSVQHINEIPEDIRQVFRTVWEVSQKSLINMASDRGAFIDQSQSLNLFISSPTIGKLSSMYMYAWEKGIKTTYYLRSRAATNISKVTVSNNKYTDEEAVACSLENPEICEACQ